ncbi:MAG: hypothetical protein IPH57_15585 [Saprospiraceae bacterium]|nr:hypothetical protein [Saprospiraceae bacterium]
MQDIELKNLWEEFSAENRLSADFSNKTEMMHFNAINLVSSMKPIKIFTLLTGILWVMAGSFFLGNIYLNSYSEANKFFLFSATGQVSLTAIAILVYLYQIITIYQVDRSKPVFQVQSSLANIRTSTLWITKVLFLQLPLWSCFWWSQAMFSEWDLLQLAIPVSITVLFAFISVWLLINIRIENRNKTWFVYIFRGKEWTPLIRSMELMDQIAIYTEENSSIKFAKL